MSPREQILTLFRGEKPDRIPWFGDLDYWANSLIKRGLKPVDFITSPDYIKWHKDLRVGFYLQGYFPFKPVYGFEEKTWTEGNRRYRELITPKGNLRECWTYLPASFAEAPAEHLVKSENDLAALRYVYENTHWEPDYDYASRRKEYIGDQGIMLAYLPRSPLMHLIAVEAGIMAVTYSEAMAPDEFAETINVMKGSFDKAAMLAVNSPAEALMIPENLSSEAVGPIFFNKYMKAYQKEWTGKIKEAGKYSFIHIDGTLEGLLREEASVGFTVLEAMTPKPVGDLGIQEWEAVAGETPSILWGGIPGSYFTPIVNDEEFDRHVTEVLDVMRKSTRYVLGVADQVPPDGLETRIRRVAELVDEYGTYL